MKVVEDEIYVVKYHNLPLFGIELARCTIFKFDLASGTFINKFLF